MQPIQNRGSMGFMERRVALPRMTGASGAEPDASNMAQRFPPSSCLMKASQQDLCSEGDCGQQANGME
jgi:hypothetical protein